MCWYRKDIIWAKEGEGISDGLGSNNRLVIRMCLVLGITIIPSNKG